MHESLHPCSVAPLLLCSLLLCSLLPGQLSALRNSCEEWRERAVAAETAAQQAQVKLTSRAATVSVLRDQLHQKQAGHDRERDAAYVTMSCPVTRSAELCAPNALALCATPVSHARILPLYTRPAPPSFLPS